jgi:hypothetical protein
VRRIFAGLIAFLAVTGMLLVLPVYAAPAPTPHPVRASVDQVALGSVVVPSDEAVVVTDGEPQPSGVEDPEAPVAPSGTPAEESPADAAPAADVVTSGAELPGVPALTVSQPDTTSSQRSV